MYGAAPERPMRNLLLAVFSPTRAIIDYWKRGKDRDAKTRLIDSWNKFFLSVSLLFVAAAYLTKFLPRMTVPIWFLLWLVPMGRVNEMWYAFWRDSIDRIRDTSAAESIDSLVHRLYNVVRSYF